MPNFYVLDVGHGNSAVLEDTKGVMVIDAGCKNDLLEFLISNGIRSVDVLLISHADKDHIAGALALLASDDVNVRSVYLNSDSKMSNIWDDFVYALFDQSTKGDLIFETSLTPNLNDRLTMGEVKVEVLGPNNYIAAKSPGGKDRKGRTLKSNSISAVIRISHEESPLVLLLGDLDDIGLDNLIDCNDDLSARLVVFPHHGGRPGNGNVSDFTRAVCERVRPEVMIFSVPNNDDRFPHIDVVEAVEEAPHDISMLTTRSSGNLLRHISDTGNDSHKDCVGTLHLDIANRTLSLESTGEKIVLS